MTQRLDPLLVLSARIEARAMLWQRGQYATIEDMMAPLYEHAIKHGLVDAVGGQEGIDQMMLDAMHIAVRQRGQHG